MDKVRAKMYCGGKYDVTGGVQIHLTAVYSNDPNSENKAFSDATPSAEMTMFIAGGKPAADLFEAGKEYYLDFTKAE